jgi:ribosome biogenesis GTPase / thiamine phosphate phosphatase
MIDDNVLQRLQAIGLTPHIVQQLSTAAPLGADHQLLRVSEVQREGLTLHDGAHERAARLLPALRMRLQAEEDAVAVGDWVLAERNAHGQWWVARRLRPTTQIARRQHDGRDKVTRLVIVANVDTALLVMGLDHDFNLRRLERYLALARQTEVGAVVVLTKADLCDAVDARLRSVQALLPPGAAVVAVNALGDEPARMLAPWLQPGQTLVLLGSSGAGKSTLTNALTNALTSVPMSLPTGASGDDNAAAIGPQKVGANRDGDNRGRHTTTARSMFITAGGACVIDTPGLRTLRLDGEAGALDGVFGDVAAQALRCRFRNCRHEAEPGCAVREAVPAERLRSYQKLQREAQRDSQTALERKAQVQAWKVRGRAGKQRAAEKRHG